MKLTGYGRNHCPSCGRFMSAMHEGGGWNLPEDYPGDDFWLCSCGIVVDIDGVSP